MIVMNKAYVVTRCIKHDGSYPSRVFTKESDADWFCNYMNTRKDLDKNEFYYVNCFPLDYLDDFERMKKDEPPEVK